MPPVTHREMLRQLGVFAEPKNTLDQLTTQQQKGIGGAGPSGASPANNVSVSEGTLFKQTGSEGGYTSGTGIEVVSQGEPVIRAGVITWHNPHTGTTETKAMLCAFDEHGNVRFTIDLKGVRAWKANGEQASWIYEY